MMDFFAGQMGKDKPVFGFQFTSYVFGSLSAGQTCMLNLVELHIVILFSQLKEKPFTS